MRVVKILFLIVTIMLCASFQLLSQTDSDNLEIGIDEHLNEKIPSKIMVVNEAGDTINLIDLLDKPTVINLVYYRCPGICSPLMDGVADVIDRSDMQLGKEYQVFTISFDPTETVELAKNKKANYIGIMEKKEMAQKGWHFFVADQTNIDLITQAVGFKYKKTGNDFLHAASIVFVNQDRLICRYLNGTFFLPLEMKMSVIEASKGNTMPTVNRVLKFCYSYDPVGQGYVLNVTKISAVVIIFFSILIFLYLIFKPRRRKKRTTPEES